MTDKEFRDLQTKRWRWLNFAAVWNIIGHIEQESRRRLAYLAARRR